MDKALSWPIKPEDTKALQVYGPFLKGCCNAMDKIQYMFELDTPANIMMMMINDPPNGKLEIAVFSFPPRHS